MIKVSIMYPQTPGTRFDHDYYRDNHLPLIKSRMGAALRYYTIDKEISGGAPGTPAPYVAMCHLLCDSLESYQTAFAPYGKEIKTDIGVFTDRIPITQISLVVVENSAEVMQTA